MILVDRQIKKAISVGALIISHMDNPNQIGPASIDLRIGDKSSKFSIATRGACFTINHNWVDTELTTEKVDRYHYIKPKQFGLYSTIEMVNMRYTEDFALAGQIEGRSSIGRQGLFIHNAGFIDPGFCGEITLELFNATEHTICIEVGTRICQLVVHQTLRPTKSYAERAESKYMYQTGPTSSRMFMDSEEIQ